MRMCEFEKGIWQAAYAACYLSDLLNMERMVRDNTKQTYPMDKALETITAGNAWRIADAAVTRYREWRDGERDGLDPFHETEPTPPPGEDTP